MIREPYYLGFDVGGTNVKVIAITETGETVKKEHFPTNDANSAEWAVAVPAKLAELITELGEPTGVGVSCPGIASEDHRTMTWMTGRMEEVVGFDWTAHLKLPFFVPVLNDAKAALVGEAWIGAAKGARNVILLTLGTGVGGAAIVDGKLLHGACGRAGHLGHISLDPNGGPDICRTPGSLENLIGDVTIGPRSGGRFNDTKTMLQIARSGDPSAKQIWAKSVQALAAGIVSLVNVLDPEVVILGGGMISARSELFEPLMKHMAEMEWLPFGSKVPIVPATLGEFAGSIGAARFAMTHGKENP